VDSSRSEDVPDFKVLPLSKVADRIRKKSRSLESLRKIYTSGAFVGHQGTGNQHPDWAEISSSANSLENTSAIHIDGDNNSLGEQKKKGTFLL